MHEDSRPDHQHDGRAAGAGSVVLFKFGRWSHINTSIESVLREHFPQQRLVVIDLWQALRRRPLVLAYMIAHGFLRDLPPVHLGKGEWGFFHLTPFAQRYLRRLAGDLAREALGGDAVAFTFQTTTRFHAKLPGIPHFVYTDTLESLKPIDPRRGRRTRLENDVIKHEQRILDDCERFMTMFEAVATAAIVDYGLPRSAVLTVYAGPNCTEPLDEPVAHHPGRKVILFTAVDWRRKGGDLLVAAFHRVLQRHPDAELWIVGPKPRGVQGSNIKLFGRQTKEQVGRFYREAAVFCLPSRRDFFPISLLEAMSSGLPVVGSRTGGVPEMIEHGKCGLVLPVGDIQALADGLIELLDDPERRNAMGRAGRQRVMELFDWSRVGARIADAIRTSPRAGQATNRSRTLATQPLDAQGLDTTSA